MALQDTTFGIQVFQQFLTAIVVTDEVAILLKQQGIDPDTVNKFINPSGFSNVGTMTILCYLGSDLDLFTSPVAHVGAMRWNLSDSFRIHHIFANGRVVNGITESLSVISFDDLRHRYGVEFGGFGTTIEKTIVATGERLGNSYNTDWSVGDGDDDEPVDESDIGYEPFDLLESLDILFPVNPGNIPSLVNKFNAWGYEADVSSGIIADKISTSCGVIAVPNMTEEGKEAMTLCYIGGGWDSGIENFVEFKNLYFSGQLNCSFAGAITKHANDAIYSYGGEDDMGEFLDTPKSPPEFWVSTSYHGNLGVLSVHLNIQFPAKDTKTGKIILYKFGRVDYGKPDMGGNLYGNVLTITDHIKTRVTIDDESLLNDEGITIIDLDGEEVPGLDEERLQILASRALHLSRSYYARAFAGVGDWTIQGFQALKPWAGMHKLEYGFRNGMPYTRVTGDLHHPLFGFTRTDVSKDVVVSSGGVMLSRPDGLLDLALSGGVGTSFITAEIVNVELSPDACIAYYDIQPFGSETVFEGLAPTTRLIPNMCYEPAVVGSICLFAVHPEADDPLDPSLQDGEYLLIVNEKVQTLECQ